jgi:hypothetical protein
VTLHVSRDVVYNTFQEMSCNARDITCLEVLCHDKIPGNDASFSVDFYKFYFCVGFVEDLKTQISITLNVYWLLRIYV